MDGQSLLYLTVILFIVYYLFITTKEGNSNTPPETISGSENAYTNINCINESLPVFKINPSGLFCLSSTANE